MGVMVAPSTWLPQLYQRFQRFWDQAVPAAGLALLLWASAEATGVYPSEWRVFLAAALFLMGLARPSVAYVAFIFLVAPPLYYISIYLAAIVLAVLILSSRWAMRNLGATMLVLATPALLPWHLSAAVPLLAGLWWGELTGALTGGMAALWLKLLAGMAGEPLDLALLSGWTPSGTNIVERFSVFNSLQTVLELVNPFADTSQGLLLHVLQVLAWALAGFLTGRLAARAWSDRQRDWAPLLSAVTAACVIWASYAFLPELLNQPKGDAMPKPETLGLWLLASAFAAAAVRGFYLYLRRPVRRPLRRRSRRAQESSWPSRPPSERKASLPGQEATATEFIWAANRKSGKATEVDDDTIMLEMD